MDDEGRAVRGSLRTLVVGVALIAVLGAYLLNTRLGGQAIVELPAGAEVGAELSRLMPQGWAFFTKPTTSATPVGFERQQGDWVVVAGLPNAQWRFALGLDRSGRRQGVEMASVLDGIGKSAWTACRGRPMERCVRQSRVRNATNPLDHPTLCGETVLAGVKPVPWQWRQLRQQTTFVSEVVRLDIR